MTANIPNSDGATFRTNVNYELNHVDATTIDGLSLWKGTQAAYNLIVTKDPNAVYFITN